MVQDNAVNIKRYRELLANVYESPVQQVASSCIPAVRVRTSIQWGVRYVWGKARQPTTTCALYDQTQGISIFWLYEQPTPYDLECGS